MRKKGYSFQIVQRGATNFTPAFPEFTRDFNTGQFKYASVPHNEEFGIRVANHTSRRSKVTIKVNGLEMGTWILNPSQVSVLNRSVDSNDGWVFLSEASREGQIASEGADVSDAGLVEVTFRGATQPVYSPRVVTLRGSGGSFKSKGGMQLQSSGGGFESISYGLDSTLEASHSVGNAGGQSLGHSTGVVGNKGKSDQSFQMGHDFETDTVVILKMRMVIPDSSGRPERVKSMFQPENPPRLD